MLAYRDFVPGFTATIRMSGWIPPKIKFESFDDAVAAANTWIVAESVKVVTVETVVLPNIYWGAGERVSTARLDHQTGLAPSLYQFVRVWYEK